MEELWEGGKWAKVRKDGDKEGQLGMYKIWQQGVTILGRREANKVGKVGEQTQTT